LAATPTQWNRKLCLHKRVNWGHWWLRLKSFQELRESHWMVDFDVIASDCELRVILLDFRTI
jgi:hypothetical protein